jgi:hypothetical protein
MNAQCAHMKSCSATTQVLKDPSAGTFRNVKKVEYRHIHICIVCPFSHLSPGTGTGDPFETTV